MRLTIRSTAGALRRVGRVSLLQVVVQDDAVLVVDDLRL